MSYGEIWKDIKGYEGYYQVSTLEEVIKKRDELLNVKKHSAA